MQKATKNWKFTLVVSILLAVLALLPTALATWLILDITGTINNEMYQSTQIVHFLAAAVLCLYVLIGLIPMFTYYRGRNIFFLVGEILVMAAMIFALIGVEWLEWIPKINPCSAFGMALWLRTSVMIVRAYLQQNPPPVESRPVLCAAEDEEDEKIARRQAREKRITARTPLWLLCLLIPLSAAGVWQMASPLLDEAAFVWAIAIFALVIVLAALAFVVVFIILTVQNRRALLSVAKEGEAATGEELPEVEGAEGSETLTAGENAESETSDEGSAALLDEAKTGSKSKK